MAARGSALSVPVATAVAVGSAVAALGVLVWTAMRDRGASAQSQAELQAALRQATHELHALKSRRRGHGSRSRSSADDGSGTSSSSEGESGSDVDDAPAAPASRHAHATPPRHRRHGSRPLTRSPSAVRRANKRRPSPLVPSGQSPAAQVWPPQRSPSALGLQLNVDHGSVPAPPGSPSTVRPTLEQLQMLLSVTRLISEGARFSDVIQRVIDVATSVVNADRVTLFLVDKYMKRLRVAVSKGSLSRQHMHMREVTLPIDHTSIAGSCAASARSTIVNDAYADPRFDKSVDAQTNYKTDTLLCVPLVNEHREVIGVVQAVNKLRRVHSSGGGSSGAGGDDDVVRPLHMRHDFEDGGDSFERAPAKFTTWDKALLEHIADFAGNELNKLQLYEQASDARIRTEKMFDLMRTISAESNVEQMIQSIINATISVVQADRVTMYLVDDSAQELIVTESRDLQGERIPIQAGIAGHVARTGETINIADAQQDPRFDDTWDKRTNYVTRSMMCIAVKDQHGKVVAILQAINKIGGEQVFTHNDLRCLEYMAGNAGIMLRKAQLMKKKERAQRATEALLDVVKLVSSDHDIHELVDGIIQAAYQLLQADMVTLFLVDPIKQELWMAVSKDMAGNRIPLGRGIVGHVAATGQVVNVPDAYEDPRFDATLDAKTGVRTRSILCVPVCVTRGKPIAVIEAVTVADPESDDHGSKRGFDETDVQALSAFSAEVALALNRKSVEAAFMKVLKDGKTVREQEFDVSLLALYSDTKTSARLHTSVRVKALEVLKPVSWPSLSSPQRTATYNSWNFDPFEHPAEKLVHVVKEMLDEFQVLSRFQVQAGVAQHFIMRVHNLYKDNPFHNFIHGFSVMHAVFLMLVQTNAAMCLSRLDIFSVLIAALCHDIDHPGHTNAFEVNSMSELALRHNDDAVLERHHAHTTFQLLLREPEAALFDSLSKEDVRQVRKNILQGILATDMSKHVRMCEVLVGKINKGATSKRRFSTVHAFRDALSPPTAQPSRFRRRAHSLGQTYPAMPTPPFNKENPQDRLLLIEALVHTADLSGQCYPARIARKWGDRVIQEFTAQARREEELGLPVMPFMQNLTRPLDRARLQLRFVNQVVLPLWTAMNELLHGLAVPVDNLYNNRMHYQAAVDRYEEESDPDDADDCDDAGDAEHKGQGPDSFDAASDAVSAGSGSGSGLHPSTGDSSGRPPAPLRMHQQLSHISEEPEWAEGDSPTSRAVRAAGDDDNDTTGAQGHQYDDFDAAVPHDDAGGDE